MDIESVVYSDDFWQIATWMKPMSITVNKEARHKAICNVWLYLYNVQGSSKL